MTMQNAPAERRRKGLLARYSPEEAHARIAFDPNARCHGCKRPFPTVRIITMVPLADVMKEPQWAAMSILTPRLVAGMTVRLKLGVYVRTRTLYACGQCRGAAERACARLPSNTIVEINAGPKNLTRKTYGIAGETG